MDVEHLWFSSPNALGIKGKRRHDNSSRAVGGNNNASADEDNNNPEAAAGADVTSQNLTVMADKRLYKLVKWCKSLPLFKNILVSFILSFTLGYT